MKWKEIYLWIIALILISTIVGIFCKTWVIITNAEVLHAQTEDLVDLLAVQIDKLENSTVVNFTIPVTVTAYNPTKKQTDDTPYQMASTAYVKIGSCAVSRDIEKTLSLKFGDLIFISGIGVFQFLDRMNKRFERRVDIFMFDPKKAKAFGKKDTTITVMRRPA